MVGFRGLAYSAITGNNDGDAGNDRISRLKKNWGGVEMVKETVNDNIRIFLESIWFHR